MKLQQALLLLVATTTTAPRGEVLQAVLVLLAHARRKRSAGDREGEKALAPYAEKGLKGLEKHFLTPFMEKARAAGLVRSNFQAAKAVIEIVEQLFYKIMVGPTPLTPAQAEELSQRQALEWLTTIAIEVLTSSEEDLSTGGMV